jgi:hypothetical protein
MPVTLVTSGTSTAAQDAEHLDQIERALSG